MDKKDSELQVSGICALITDYHFWSSAVDKEVMATAVVPLPIFASPSSYVWSAYMDFKGLVCFSPFIFFPLWELDIENEDSQKQLRIWKKLWSHHTTKEKVQVQKDLRRP